MNHVRGNLALKPVRPEIQPRRRMLPPARPTRPSGVRIKRVEMETLPAHQAFIMNQQTAIRRELTARRLKALVGMVSVIMLLAGLYGIMVYRQAMILEANFANIRVENTIGKLDQESSQISEALAQKTNLDLIRKQAVEKLGLQDPAHRQIIHVIIPDSDRVVYASAASSLQTDSQLANIFSNIEGYFKNMNQQRQGD